MGFRPTERLKTDGLNTQLCRTDAEETRVHWLRQNGRDWSNYWAFLPRQISVPEQVSLLLRLLDSSMKGRWIVSMRHSEPHPCKENPFSIDAYKHLTFRSCLYFLFNSIIVHLICIALNHRYSLKGAEQAIHL